MEGDNEKDHEADEKAHVAFLAFLDLSCEVVENCLNAFECFVLQSSKEISPQLDELCAVILTLISYDPNFYDGDAQDAVMEEFEEFDDDGLVDSDDDDNSWKDATFWLTVARRSSGLWSLSSSHTDICHSIFRNDSTHKRNHTSQSSDLDV